MRTASHHLVLRRAGALAVLLVLAACSDRVTAPSAPPTPLAPERALAAVFPQTVPMVYPVDVSVYVNELKLQGTFQALYAVSGNDRAIAFFPMRSNGITIRGGGVLSFVGGVSRGQGAIVAVIGQGPPSANPTTITIDFAQFNGFQGDPLAGGIPGGGCIFAGGIPGGGDLIAVRLDFVPHRR